MSTIKDTLLKLVEDLVASGKSREEAIEEVLNKEYIKLEDEVKSLKDDILTDKE